MFGKVASIAAVALLFTGCASVPMTDTTASSQAKKFAEPAQGKAGIYVCRDGNLGAALKKDIWVDGECLGESASKVFFYKEVAGDKDHTISTESEFSPNILTLHTKSGTNYFVRQYMKMGLFVGGANLELVEQAKGKAAVQELGMAKGGVCSK